MSKEADLMMFYGKESPACKEVKDYLEKIEKEEEIEIKKLEVWHDSSNQSIMMKYAEERCVGVPFLYNKKTGEYLCGKHDFETVKNWALGE